MESWVVILTSLVYLGLLFLIAFLVDRQVIHRGPLKGYRWIYALTLPVYCTAWTYYGSVGKAVEDGWAFLTIYLGPIITIPLWWIIIRKMIRICELQRISTLADFIVSRFEKSLTISVLATVFMVIGIIPYISIQLKSIVSAFSILTTGNLEPTDVNASMFLLDSAFYLSILLALFIIVFVFRSIETVEKHEGMMTAIAVDSVVKLIAFLGVGVFVTFVVFDGFGNIFSHLEGEELKVYTQFSEFNGAEWPFMLLLSMSAIILLPRQFQVTVAENREEKDLKTAAWVFPLYLFLINIFVVPIAIGGKVLLPAGIDPDGYVIALPLALESEGLALLTFIGGFSAATGMIIVSTIALSMMLSNNVVVPLILRRLDSPGTYSSFPLKTRRLAVFIILLMAYLYYRFVASAFPLVSIGLISFAAMIQFLPAVLGALFWKEVNKESVIWGLTAGFVVWAFTLVVPTVVKVGLLPQELLTQGLFGFSWLRPESIFGISLNPIANGTFWSLFFNLTFFVAGILFKDQSLSEQQMADLYVDIYKHSSLKEERVPWKGNLVYHDLQRVSTKLLGIAKANEAFDRYTAVNGDPLMDGNIVDSRYVTYTERMLSGVVGSASARMVIKSLAKEEEIELNEVVNILKETSETARLNTELESKSKELRERTHELEKANDRLENLDKEKDEFISIVTHELRTPLTSIKAFVEILQDGTDIDPPERENFLGIINDEIDRMTRLINQVLDMEKLESGMTKLTLEDVQVSQVLHKALTGFDHLVAAKGIEVHEHFPGDFESCQVLGDADRLTQVFVNLIGNAIKYADKEKPLIEVSVRVSGRYLEIEIRDNGKGIKAENIPHLFEKFFQAKEQTRKKTKGTGLGLAITKKILDLHEGSIEVKSTWEKETIFTIALPLVSVGSERTL